MPNNFKLTGDYYVSIDGNDSNNGTSKDTPKRTVQAGLNLITTTGKKLIIGAGVYKETIYRSISSVNYDVYGDGTVIFEGTGLNSISIGSTGTVINFYDITIKNYDTITTFLSGGVSGFDVYFYRCSLYNTKMSLVLGTINLQNCVYIQGSVSGSQTVRLTSSIVYNVKFFNTLVNICLNSYLDPGCILSCWSSIQTANFNYNNIQCPIIMSIATSVTTGVYQDIYGRYYDLSITTSTGDGTVGNPYGRPYTNGAAFSFANHRILYPTYNANSFSSDPKFNDIQAQDFTLQATSPHIGKASDGTNIGGTKYAIRYSAKGDAFNTSAVSVTALNFVGNDYSITSPNTSGEVVSAPILISAAAKVLQKITYNGLLEFNKLISGGTAGNRNVPDQDVYTAGTQGANPDRLVYYMRYSTQTSQPTADAQWNNGGYWTAGNYGVFEWNTKPSIDNAFVGNGDPTFNAAATPTYLQATWIQLKVKLRNNYA